MAITAAFRARFLARHEATAEGALPDWERGAEGALAPVIPPIPGRAMRPEEQAYLDGGGYAG